MIRPYKFAKQVCIVVSAKSYKIGAVLRVVITL